MTDGLLVWKTANTALEWASQNPEKVRSLWQKIWALVSARQQRVIITGAKGAGKSVLADFLSGEGMDLGYEPKMGSTKVEYAKIAGENVALSVMPGEENAIKSLGMHAAFAEDFVGVIHVVCHGMDRKRTGAAHVVAELARDADPLPGVLAHYGLVGLDDEGGRGAEDLLREALKEEVRVLSDVCSRIESSWHSRKNKKPIFLMIVVTKADLWGPLLWRSAANRYDLKGNSEVAQIVRAAQSRVGEMNLHVDSWPVATWLEEQSAFGLRFETDGDRRRRDQLVQSLKIRILETVSAFS